MTDVAPPALIGRSIGGYQVQSLLGSGGMGEVYLARDSKLGRDVAIKILPRAVTSDPDRLARFDREARMLAALNHPNICAIYGLEETDGIRFLILERVDGTTLAERIEETEIAGLPIAEVLSIARQIAEALEAAHGKGIVHRDLKPANIKITPDGVVKVLDFGLAKPITADGSAPDLTQSPTVTVAGTREGVILGTAPYMSPEQARGRAIDKRTDIWAFGCVLYEMLTGRVPFDGDTVSDTIGKILEREPDWSVLPATTPAAMRRLLLRCLAKDPRQRLRDIGDVRIEIDAIDELLPGMSEGVATPPVPTKTLTTWLPWTAAVMLAASVGVWEARRPVTSEENPLANAQFTRLTDWEGTEGGAEISPDGRFVAFLADRDGEFDVWLSQVGTGDSRNLTTNIAPLRPLGRILRSFGFSGDGAEIWFSVAGDPGLQKMLVPLIGGAPRAFLGEGNNAPSYSPDGTHIVYLNNIDGDPLFVADRNGADARPILAPDEKGLLHNHNPVWSPDGQWIYFVRGLDPTDEMDVWRIRPSGESLERLTEQHAAVMYLAPIGTRMLLYVARAEDRSGPWLWALDLATKVTRRVSPGVDHYTSVSASHDGRRVVATIANPTSSLWTVPILDRQAEDRDAKPFPVAMMRASAPRFAGTSLFFVSSHGTGDELWRFHDGQASEVWKGANRTLSEPPAVSPDGLRMIVVVRQDGKRHMAIMSADGTNSRTLAAAIDIEGDAGQATADWSPDGASIVTGGKDEAGPGLFRIPVAGGATVRLFAGQAVNPVWSPDGNLIVFAGGFMNGQATLRGVRPDGAPVELPQVRVRQGGYRFLPGGSRLVYLPLLRSLDFWLLDLVTMKTRQLTRLSDQGLLATFDITPDGKHIVFDRSREKSDIVLIDLPK